ncbi:MAG: hypothetical protein GTO00_11000 [Deltaproteobacteria bacterium]|nr:hypothetical protein [Candidatus Latescibacterota bacterium]NIS78096.1 hypothetical protein [Deltaproteobacteria bacterium]
MLNTSKHELIVLGLLWFVYCFIHSLLIADPVKVRAEAILKERFAYYRLFFNVLSAVLLVPVVLYAARIDSRPIFRYRGPWITIQVFLLSGGTILFYLGAKAYDMKEFLGLRQIRGGESSAGGELSTKGVLGFVRHPWYLAAIMVIWARNIGTRELTTNLILTAYLIIGTYLEERSLVKSFGDRYREYQREVSMLLPIKWLKKRIRE